MRRTIAGVATAVIVALTLAACGDSDPLGGDSKQAGPTGEVAKPSKLIVGSANFPESALLAEIYAGVFRD